ncbi:putative hydrolase [Naematelia encephala]|uniref:Putative hydrolase n=1 Tax=Naematelia encephala TaxID=71784 RepID=A0A1Y2BMJ0_9TREE|nr:putative hydrolase [Naematelia encephala]
MSPQKVIIDTDPGVDDVLAILLGLASPEIDVALINIVFGNTHAPVAHSNLLKIYHLLAQEVAAIPEAEQRYARLQGQNKTVLALGEDGPIGGDKAVAAYFHGVDGLSNISETHPHFTPSDLEPESHEHLDLSPKPSWEATLDLLKAEPEGTVTIVALGPLTNLAHSLRADPTTFARVKNVVWMGGALDVPGNTAPCAEFNCFADPYAAVSILQAAKSGLFEMIMAPLDITTPHTVPFDDLIHEAPSAPLRQFISAMLKRVRGLQASFGLPDAMEMHDPVAVWYAIAHASVPRGQSAEGWAVRGREFNVERKGELTRGMCVVDRRGTGEEGVDRTESEKLKGNSVPSLEKDRTSDKPEEGKSLPWVVVRTPGSAELRRVLLGRVFGEEV